MKVKNQNLSGDFFLGAIHVWNIRGFLKGNNGNVAITAAIVLPVVVSMGGGAIEFGARLNSENDLQHVLDGAVLAGVSHDGTEAERLAEAIAFFEATRFRLEYVPSVEWAWEDTGANPVLVANGTSTRPTLFLGLIGINEFNISVRSAGTTAQGWGDACFMAMHETDSHTIEMDGDVRIEAPNCHFYGNSDHFDDVVDLHSCTNVLNARMVQSVGGGHHAGIEPDYCDGLPVSENIPSGVFLNSYVVQDPIGHHVVEDALAMAEDCEDEDSDAFHDTVVIDEDTPSGRGGPKIEPGTYCDGLEVLVDAEFEEGIYFLFGDFIIEEAEVEGKDVTFVLSEDVNFEWTDSIIEFSAPDGHGRGRGRGNEEELSGMAVLGLNEGKGNQIESSIVDIEGVVYMPLAKIYWENSELNEYDNMRDVRHHWTVWIAEGVSFSGDGTIYFNFPSEDFEIGSRHFRAFPESLRGIVPESNSQSARLVR